MPRRAQPAAVKQAKGNPGRRKIADESDLAKPDRSPARTFAPPARFKGMRRLLWKQLVPQLVELRLLRTTDLPAFERYVGFLAKWRDAEKLLEKAKLVQVTSSEHVQNMERVSKALMVSVMLDKRLSEIEDRFGMNPAARQSLLMKMAAAQPSLPFGQQGKDNKPADQPAAVTPPPSAGPVGILSQPQGSA